MEVYEVTIRESDTKFYTFGTLARTCAEVVDKAIKFAEDNNVQINEITVKRKERG